MVNSYLLRIQEVPRTRVFLLIFVLLFSCPDLLASQEAIVTTDRAVIYSDQEMTSPVGYAARGKKIAVGEIARNKAQVYPIVVSGKIAYIRVIDVSTEKETMKSSNLTAERFSRQTLVAPQAKYVASYYSYLSQIAVSKKNEKLEKSSMKLRNQFFKN